MESGRALDPAVVSTIYDRFDGVTSYMHRVLNVLYSRTEKGSTCTVAMIDDAVEFIVRLSSDTYESLLYQMPLRQRDVFLAIASEGTAREVTGGAFVRRHSLVSPSAVASAVKGLLEKDFITNDRGEYMVYDRFFRLWLSRKGLI